MTQEQAERVVCATCGRPLTYVVHRYFHVLGSRATNDRRPWDHEPAPVADRRTEAEDRLMDGNR